MFPIMILEVYPIPFGVEFLRCNKILPHSTNPLSLLSSPICGSDNPQIKIPGGPARWKWVNWMCKSIGGFCEDEVPSKRNPGFRLV